MSNEQPNIGFLDRFGLQFDDLVIGQLKDPFFGDDSVVDHIGDKWDLRSAEALSRLDAKASALLTHISMMIGIAAFLANHEKTSTLELIVLSGEMIVYLFFALCCLRALPYRDVIAPKGGVVGAALTKPIHEYSSRVGVVHAAAYVNFVNRWVFFVTFIFALTLATHVIL